MCTRRREAKTDVGYVNSYKVQVFVVQKHIKDAIHISDLITASFLINSIGSDLNGWRSVRYFDQHTHNCSKQVSDACKYKFLIKRKLSSCRPSSSPLKSKIDPSLKTVPQSQLPKSGRNNFPLNISFDIQCHRRLHGRSCFRLFVN